ncbi:hypothetical protein HMPREF1006_02181 [Synergistes sp. 3_1_syn1]|nr:hypothetical protein HMPREF1006_02181 [Synergistes sp. 3_1_syn1]
MRNEEACRKPRRNSIKKPVSHTLRTKPHTNTTI